MLASASSWRADLPVCAVPLPGAIETSPLIECVACASLDVVHGRRCLYGLSHGHGQRDFSVGKLLRFGLPLFSMRCDLVAENVTERNQRKTAGGALIKIPNQIFYWSGTTTFCANRAAAFNKGD